MDLDEALRIGGVYAKVHTRSGVKTTTFRFLHSNDEITFKYARGECEYYNRELQKCLLSLDTVDKDYEDPNYASIASLLTAWKTIADRVLKESNQKATSSKKYSSKTQPSLFDDESFRKIVEIMSSHKIKRVIDPSIPFGYVNKCTTCGELSMGDEEDFHIAHMLLVAGFTND